MKTVKDILRMMLRDHTARQRWNYLKYKFSEKNEALPYGPVTISIVATARCTLSCDMCPTHSRIVSRDYEHAQANVRDMDFTTFKEIIDTFDRAIEVNIIGSGEPLLNRDFFRMVDYASSKKMGVKVFSNGTTIADNMDKILDSKLDGITISINGHDAKEFDRMTGMGEDVYHKILEAAKRLLEEKKRRSSKIRIKLSFIIDRHNYRSIPEMVDLGLKMGADYIFLCNFLSSPYEGLRAEERTLWADAAVIGEIKSAIKDYPKDIRRKIALPVLLDEKAVKNRCKTHFTQIRFDGDGNVSSCSIMLLNMAGHGNYKDNDVWNNAFFRKQRRLFISGASSDMPGPCRVCPDNKGVKI